jgi:NAD-dependent SIR2 family protein deacetylase
LPEPALAAALRSSANADVFLSIGTSSLVQPAASLPRLARERGAQFSPPYLKEISVLASDFRRRLRIKVYRFERAVLGLKLANGRRL